MDATVTLLISAMISMVLFYFVIKQAVKDAIHSELKMINKNLTLMQEQKKPL